MSPKKSWEGFAGSLLAAVGAGAVCLWSLDGPVWTGALLGATVVVISTLGDLGESLLKRDLGLGMVFISHDIQTVRYLSDEIAVMHKGRVVEFGSAADVFDAPSDPYTRSLLGAAPSLLA